MGLNKKKSTYKSCYKVVIIINTNNPQQEISKTDVQQEKLINQSNL